jgi:hypothetical protein
MEDNLKKKWKMEDSKKNNGKQPTNFIFFKMEDDLTKNKQNRLLLDMRTWKLGRSKHLLSNGGSQTKNGQQRRNNGLGVINQIMKILESTFSGKYYFEVEAVLRES